MTYLYIALVLLTPVAIIRLNRHMSTRAAERRRELQRQLTQQKCGIVSRATDGARPIQ